MTNPFLNPRLALDFTGANLDPCITFTRAANTATVSVQRSPDGTNWFDVNTYTAPIEGTGFDPEFNFYRIGVKTGDYTSGTVDVRLGVPWRTSVMVD
jgi:hypothetical protein